MSVNYVWPDTDVNITNLPLSNPLCGNDTCLAYEAAHMASQAQISWASQFWYGYYVSMFYGLIIAAFSVVYFANRLHAFYAARYPSSPSDGKPTSGDKFVARVRNFTYRRLSGRAANALATPSAGLALLVTVSFLFSVILSFAQHPYYRGDRGFGSPPLGVRTGMAGIALTPITFALSGKYNFVTLITGISHEKLNFMHRWCGIIYLFFGIVHTVPFLVNDYTSGGPKRLYYQFYSADSQEYTGIPALACLVFLAAFSNPWFRKMSYEVFVHSHILAAIAFLGTMFWHADDTLDSWMYLWFTVAIYSVQLLARAWDKTAIVEWSARKQRASTAQIEVLDNAAGSATMLRLSVPTALNWQPGEHVFLRFPTLRLLDNHPFTLASVPEWNPADAVGESTGNKYNTMLFLIRPYNGMTASLLKRTQKKGLTAETTQLQESKDAVTVRATSSLPVRIDGPYGGSPQHHALHQLYDHVILVAGGGGISSMLPWLMRLSGQLADPERPCRMRTVNLIWCIRHANARAWVEQEVSECIRMSHGRVHVDVHVTGDADASSVASPLSDLPLDDPKPDQLAEVKETSLSQTSSGSQRSEFAAWELHQGRPSLPQLLRALVRHRRTMILGCGPESLKVDVSNAAAELQAQVLADDVDEIALHTETFGW